MPFAISEFVDHDYFDMVHSFKYSGDNLDSHVNIRVFGVCGQEHLHVKLPNSY